MKKTSKALASTVALCLVLSTSSVFAAENTAVAPERLSGANRVDTAVKIAEKSFNEAWKGQGNAILSAAADANLVDSLAVAPLSYQLKAPILLNDAKDSINADTLKALKANNVKTVYIATGEGVISNKAKAQLEKEGFKVERLGGKNRYETAKNILDTFKKNGGDTKNVALVSGNGLADALSVAPEAARKGMPILLTDGKDAVAANLAEVAKAADTVYAIGGNGIISDALVQQLKADRVSGHSRYETNAAVIKKFAGDKEFSKIYLGNGQDGHLVDSLTGSVLAAQSGSPIVLADKNLADATKDALKGKVSDQTGVVALGGEAVVSDNLVKEVTNIANESPEYVAADKAVKAYEDAKITTAEEITAAKALKAPAVKAVEAVKDQAQKDALNARIAAKDKAIEEAEAKLKLNVESVSAITKTGVTVAFKEAPEKDLEGVTVKVVNNAGEEVEVVALDILKGEKEATFKFAKSLTEDPKGVWTVDGVAYDIDTIKLIEKVVNLSVNPLVKELEFYDALVELGIKDVDATKLQDYADEIALANPTTVEAIQKAVDKANEGSVEADEKKAIAVAVYEVKDNIVQLRAALLDNGFKYVNTEWVADYQTELNTSAFSGKTKDTVTAAEYDKIQADINTVNNTEIGNAKNAVADVKTANEYKALVFDYMVEDAAGVDTKAKALEEADKFIALMELKASDSSVETYRLLAQLLGDDAKLLNDNNKKEYYDAKVAYKTGDPAVSSITTATTASDLVTNVVDKGDKAALDNALAAIAGMTANTAPAGQADNGTKVEIVKANLQKLADVTNHKKDDAKFDMAIVKDAKLADYRDALLADGVPATLTTAKAVTDVIEGINEDVNEEARVKAVNEASTAAEMKVALTDIALEEGNTDYINLSSEAKLEVAAMVLEARPSKGFEATTGEGAKTASEVISAEITKQLGARKALIDNVNKIDVVGDTAAFDFDAVDTALTALDYDAYNDLKGLARVNAAQAFYDNIPTVEKKDGTLEQVEYKTLAEIKVAIDAAIK